jgi:hypothetical protein
MSFTTTRRSSQGRKGETGKALAVLTIASTGSGEVTPVAVVAKSTNAASSQLSWLR